MASIQADALHSLTTGSSPLSDPTASPCWTRPEHTLQHSTTALQWAINQFPILQTTKSSTVALTTFQDILTNSRKPALCTAEDNLLTITMDTVYTVTLPTPIVQLHPCNGLIIRLASCSYHYLSHPLHDTHPLDLHHHNILHVSPDLPLLVTFTTKLHLYATTLNHSHHKQSHVTLSLSEILTLHASADATVAVAHDLTGSPVVCIISNRCLTGLSPAFNSQNLISLTPSFKIRDVVTALPILSIRQPQNCLDLLVQSAAGGLSLYAGRNRLCTIAVQQPTNFRIAHPVHANFTVVTEHQRVRYSLQKCAFVNPLVNDCLAAISAVLLNTRNSRRLACLYQALIAARSTSENSEWHTFEKTILNVAHCDDNTVVNDEDSWTYLLRHHYHHKRENLRRFRRCPHAFIQLPSTDNRYNENLQQIFHALHLLYEDYKLDSHKNNDLRCLVILLTKVAVTLGAHAFVEHYRKDFPDLVPTMEFESTQTTSVPSIMQTLVDRIQGSLVRPYPIPSEDINQVCKVFATWRQTSPYELSRRVCSYYDILYSQSTRQHPQDRKSEMLLSQMTTDGFTKEDLDRLPLGVCLPLRNALFISRVLPCLSVTMDSLALLNREDMLETDLPFSSYKNENFTAVTTAMLRLNSFVGHADPLPTPRELHDAEEQDQKYAEEDLDDSPRKHRFCDDRRIHEVTRILRSTDETVISPIVTKPAEQSADFDLASELKLKLGYLVKKRLAAPVGRGAFTLRTFVPSDPTQSLCIPPLCTTGKLLGQKGARVTLAAGDADLVQWGEFHNGVAAGLRIVASSSNGDQEVGHILSRTWIVNHRPDNNAGSPGHAGMLLACGLSGYLPALKKTDYYQYLLSRHELTSIGLMLGLSVCNIGSMDEKITKMLCLHVRSFNVAGFAVPDFHVSVNTQTAAILGMGLLHKSSVEIGVLQGLMQELIYKPQPGDAIDNREGLALAAGLGIGLVCLGKGSAINAAETEISDRLLTLANGGLSNLKNSPHESPSFQRSEIEENGLHGQASLPESETSRIDEKGKINTDVASPAALLALALIYVKTNDERLMKRIQLPSTLYSLDRVKPLHVYIVVLTRALVMWDSISASEAWLAENIPSLLHGVNPNGESSPMYVQGKVNIPNGLRDEDIDVDGLMQARAFAVTGAFTAIALRYAGTSDPEAMAIIKAGCESFEEALRKRENGNLHIQWVYMTCMCSAALSLSIVAAGSGDLDIFRVLRRLRKVSVPSLNKTRYGFHLALNLAIGFLFLGGGCLTFGSSTEAIFGLLCAIYPHFPLEADDNRYHLQAFRHLYVLSVEPRCIETRDVDTGKSCSVDIKLKMRNGNTVELRAPCIVPDANSVKEVVIASERYMPRSVQLNPPTPGRGWFSHTSNQIVYVKRRVGHLPHEVDPKGSRSIFARTLPYRSSGITLERSADAVERDLARLYSADPEVLSFDKFYCGSGLSEDGVVKLHKEALQECLVGDKTGALYHFVDIWRISALLRRGCIDPVSVGSLRILSAYFGFDKSSDGSLLRPSLVASVLRQANGELGGDQLFGFAEGEHGSELASLEH